MDARIVDEAGYRAKLLVHGLEQAQNVGFGRRIDLHGKRGAARLLDIRDNFVRQIAFRAIGDADGVAVRPAQPRGRGADVLDDAIRRANAYREAGARSLFIPGVADGQTIGRLAGDISGPINILAGPKTPPVSELEALGVARLSVGGGFARSAYTAAREAAQELRDRGTFEYTKDTFSNADLNAMLRRDDA